MPNAIFRLLVLLLSACLALVHPAVTLVRGSAEFPQVVLEEPPVYLGCVSCRFSGKAMHSGSPIASVEYCFDSGPWMAAEAVDGMFGDSMLEEFSFGIDSLEDGVHTVQVKATTCAGYTTPSSQYAKACFTVDSVDPTLCLTVVSPDPTPDADPELTGWAADNGSWVASVEYRIDGGAWLPAAATDGGFESASENFTIRLTALSDGERTVAARAVDAAGNMSEVVKRSFVVDTSGPAMVMDSLPAYVSENELVCTGQAIDESSRTTSVLFRLDHGEWLAATAIDGAFDDSSELWEFSLSNLAEGPHDVRIRGVDELGNVTLDREMAVAGFVVDTVAPNVSLSSPEGTATDDTCLLIRGMASDLTSPVVAVQYRIDGGEWTGADADDGDFNGGQEAFTAVVTDAAPGVEYLIDIKAEDAAGNESVPASARLAFTVASDVDEENHEGSGQELGDTDGRRMWWILSLFPALVMGGLVVADSIANLQTQQSFGAG